MIADPAEQRTHRTRQRHQHDQSENDVDRVAVEPEPEQRRRTDQEHGPGNREHHLVERPSDTGQRTRHSQGSESIMEAVGVVDRGGDADVRASHHGGDGEHGGCDEVDVADARRESRAHRRRCGRPG